MNTKFRIFAVLVFLVLLFFLSSNPTGNILTLKKPAPLVVWYVGLKNLSADFLEKAEAYKPDIVLLTVYSEDSLTPLNNNTFHPEDLKLLIQEIHKNNIKVYYSFSLFSRSRLPYEDYQKLEKQGISYEDQKIHVADYALELKHNNEDEYYKIFDYYLERGVTPESIPHIKRKPVDGFYVEPGHYTAIDPLYKPYRDYMVKVVKEIIQIEKPDGIVFDHGRFFTFDEGYNHDIRNYILKNFNFDIYGYTPVPMFLLDMRGWKEEDRIYYYSRAKVMEFAVSDILSNFPEFEIFGTTMGMTEPARSNGQYAELQANSYDSLLLMAYDEDSEEVARNVRETSEVSGKDVILGIYPFSNETMAINNIDAGLASGARGVYLLDYRFSDVVNNYLLEIRGLN